ncbi:MAG TPA: AMP-binding protein, partial [Longimicrobiaceae bacterium]|nr:AMP-binding protein [Longimicrobiaceae bacterium]
AYVTYTSGSTGRPKGVVGTHRNAHNRLAWLWREHPPRPGEVWSHKTALGFVDSNLEIFGALGAGVPLAVLPEAVLRDPEALTESLRAARCTRLVLVPSLLRALLDAYPDLGARLPELTLWITSGERLPPDLLRRFRQSAPGATLLNLYGTSEVIDATCQVVTGEDAAADAPSAPIGLPIDNVRAHVLDAGMRPAPVGVAGELYVAGDGVARGYHGRPELTAERFLPDPFATGPGARMYRTGDRARRREDGALEYLGRADTQAKVRGHRVEPGEVEAVLREHPGIGDAAVVAREDAPGEVRLAAYVTPREGAGTPTARTLRSWAAERLPEPLIPTVWVHLERLPLLPNGKVDRRALPVAAASDDGAGYVPPRDTLEMRLVHVWEGVLGRRMVGVRDSFVELGGDSIAAIRAALRLSRLTGARVSPSLLLAEQTVEGLAAALRRGAAEASPSPLVPLHAAGSRPPLFLVHALGGSAIAYLPLAGHLGPEQPVYGLQSPGLDGAPEPVPDIAAMAGEYLEAVREVQPRGPYRLGGWSMGGLVAWEMARRLRARGETVEFLALVDTLPSEPHTGNPADDLSEVASFALHLGLSLDGGPTAAEARALGVEGCLVRLLDGGRAAGLLPPETDLPELRRRFDVLRANHAAVRAYRPGPLDAAVTLFLAEDEEHAGTAAFWGGLAAGGVEIRCVPGDHFTLVREPRVRTLAAELAAALDGARARGA